MSDQLVVMKSSELKKMISDSVKEALDNTKPQRYAEHEEPIPMSVVINSKRYGSRNTMQKYRDQIMAEGNDPVIFKKQGSRYYMYLDRFRDWFMKQKDIHEEKLKIDPRLRG
ncbi:hypothetical protein [Limosilactobacillus vaginalis]|uniref:hypothetical protein n=1 Tax=Limosilactobacillus vaginalis TaxID=1633 RepID=UPI002359FF5E|nr:hypothetical protein [Limosilactobacillus vaginalis]WCT58854.1 hypothetical protein PRK59_07710 [Limosilactobacillus vaginalis]